MKSWLSLSLSFPAPSPASLPSFPPSLRGSQPPAPARRPARDAGQGEAVGDGPGKGRGREGREGEGLGLAARPRGRAMAPPPPSTTAPRLHERRRPLRREAAAAHSPQRLLHVPRRALGCPGGPGVPRGPGGGGQGALQEEGGKEGGTGLAGTGPDRDGSGLVPGCRAALSPPAPHKQGALTVVEMRRFAFFPRPFRPLRKPEGFMYMKQTRE